MWFNTFTRVGLPMGEYFFFFLSSGKYREHHWQGQKQPASGYDSTGNKQIMTTLLLNLHQAHVLCHLLSYVKYYQMACCQKVFISNGLPGKVNCGACHTKRADCSGVGERTIKVSAANHYTLVPFSLTWWHERDAPPKFNPLPLYGSTLWASTIYGQGSRNQAHGENDMGG